MGAKSGIEWTEATWNPVTGCDKVSQGCKHCYALAQAKRLQAMGSARYANGFKVTTHQDVLELPYRWQRSRRIFVNSMSDLFHKDVPDGFIAWVFDVMGQASQHTYQILTKRPERMAEFCRRWSDHVEPDAPPICMARGPAETRQAYRSGRAMLFADMLDEMGPPPEDAAYPTYGWLEGQRWWPAVLPNVWLGTSVESQDVIDRVRLLTETPAAVRFLSCEPLLGPLDLAPYLDKIDWVIVGGESGPHARPMEADWVRGVRDQCLAAGTAFFFKQWGGRTSHRGHEEAVLDGELWKQMPEVLGRGLGC